MQRSFMIMGVLNITPDSFSDGGNYFETHKIKNKIEEMILDHVDVIDVGAQSSRPGANPISESEEVKRLELVLPWVDKYQDRVAFSLDTDKEALMCKASSLGFKYINNINGLPSNRVFDSLRKQAMTTQLVLMHKHGNFQDMQKNPLSAEEGIERIEHFFKDALSHCVQNGFDQSVWLDPGVGFGKTDSLNLKILDACKVWSQKYNLVVGVSRKSFIGRLTDIEDPAKRDQVSKMLELALVQNGVKMIRTHDVKGLERIRRALEKNV